MSCFASCEALARSQADEQECLSTLPLTAKSLGPDQDIVREGNRPSECCLVVEGFACRYKLTDEGKRQIFSFHIPGDIPDLQSLHLKVMDHSLMTLTPCKLAFISHQSLTELLRKCPRVADVMWRDTLIDAAIFREWMMGIGRRSAYTRIAHVLCEVFFKMKSVGLGNGNGCEWPVTQAELGDALGLSTCPRQPFSSRTEGRRPHRASRWVTHDPELGWAEEGRRVRSHVSPP